MLAHFELMYTLRVYVIQFKVSKIECCEVMLKRVLINISDSVQ